MYRPVNTWDGSSRSLRPVSRGDAVQMDEDVVRGRETDSYGPSGQPEPMLRVTRASLSHARAGFGRERMSTK